MDHLTLSCLNLLHLLQSQLRRSLPVSPHASYRPQRYCPSSGTLNRVPDQRNQFLLLLSAVSVSG
nr:MAG TPA: hypothetical protein [Caudoviricetes sp.]